MIDLIESLVWVFPSPSAVGIWFLWLAVAFGYHFLANGQELPNKLNNARKYALALSFYVTAAVTAQWLNGEGVRVGHPIVIGVFVYLIVETGDWLSYLAHLWKISPGGVQGWFWIRVTRTLTRHIEHAKHKYTESLDPAEVAMINRVSVFNLATTGEHLETSSPSVSNVGDPTDAERMRKSRSHANRGGAKSHNRS